MSFEWFVLKKYIVKIFLFRHSRNLLLYNVCTTMLTYTIDEWYRLLILFAMFRKYDKKKLTILDNSGIDYSRMLLFVLGFLVYWKI